MRKLILTSKYKKDMKAVKKDPIFRKHLNTLANYLVTLQNGGDLPASADNHPLSKSSPKEYKGCWDFHVVPDLCVVYRMTKDAIELLRIGQHNNLGLTENFEN